MNIGKMRYRITVQERIDGDPDRMGGFSTSYQDLFSCWADVEVSSGAFSFRGDQRGHDIIYKIRIRYREDFPENGAIVFNGQRFFIDKIYPDPLKREIILECSGVQNSE